MEPAGGVESAAVEKLAQAGTITAEPRVVCISSGAGYKDETVVKFTNTATDAFDRDWDAYKLAGGKSAPYIATVIGDSVDLSINSLAEMSGDTIIQIRVNVPGRSEEHTSELQSRA